MKNRETTFSCVEELVDDMIDTVLEFDDEFASVTLVANSELTNKVFKEFSSIEVNGFEISYGIVEINNEEYDDLYYLTFGNDGKVWVEKAWHEDNQWHKAGYLYTESDLVYLAGCDGCKEIMDAIDGNEILIFDIED